MALDSDHQQERVTPEVREATHAALVDNLGREESFANGIRRVAVIACEAGIPREEVGTLVRDILLEPRSLQALKGDVLNELAVAYGIVGKGTSQMPLDETQLSNALRTFLASYKPSDLIVKFFSDLVLQDEGQNSVPNRDAFIQWATNESMLRDILGVVSNKVMAVIDEIYANPLKSPYRRVESALETSFRMDDEGGVHINLNGLKGQIRQMIEYGMSQENFIMNFVNYVKHNARHLVKFLEVLFGSQIKRTLNSKEWEDVANGNIDPNDSRTIAKGLWLEVSQQISDERRRLSDEAKRKAGLANGGRRGGGGRHHHRPFGNNR